MQHKDGGHMSRKWNSVWQPTDLMLRGEVVVADEDLTVGGRDWMSDGTLLTLYTLKQTSAERLSDALQ